MKTIYTTFACLLLSVNVLFAQHAQFTSSGTIVYQKTSNMYAIIKKLYSGMNMGGMQTQLIDQYQKNQPQFKVLKSTLVFSNNKMLFTPIVPDGPMQNSMSAPIAEQINTIYTDETTNTGTTQKLVSDATFLIRDTLRKITWKITNETRDIAGYPCRRANGIMLDSIYVVAFYTDKITVPGGPESFGGLPGMILQVAVPHENVSWVATKVTPGDVAATVLVPPKKGKPVNNKQFREFLTGLFGKQVDGPRQAMLTKGLLL